MTQFVPAVIGERWELILPRHRMEFYRDRPKWEIGRLLSCSERMEPGMTVYDIGAEHGCMTSLYQRWVGDTGDVIPFEPSPPYWPCIRETYEANDLLPPGAYFAGFAGAVTHTPNDPTIDGRFKHGWSRCAYQMQNSDEDIGMFRHLAQEADSVPQVRLDDFVAESLMMPDVVVIDVEGAEWDVLAGMTGILLKASPLVYVSVHDIGDWNPLWGWYGHTVQDLDDLMAGYGYGRTELPWHGEGERFYLYERP